VFGSDKYEEQVKSPLTVCGKTAAALIDDEEEPILFIPVSLEVADDVAPAFALTFEDQVLFAWSTGKLRLTYFAEIVHQDDVQSIEETSPFAIDMTTDRPWWLQTHATAFRDRGFFDGLMASLTAA